MCTVAGSSHHTRHTPRAHFRDLSVQHPHLYSSSMRFRRSENSAIMSRSRLLRPDVTVVRVRSLALPSSQPSTCMGVVHGRNTREYHHGSVTQCHTMSAVAYMLRGLASWHAMAGVGVASCLISQRMTRACCACGTIAYNGSNHNIRTTSSMAWPSVAVVPETRCKSSCYCSCLPCVHSRCPCPGRLPFSWSHVQAY